MAGSNIGSQEMPRMDCNGIVDSQTRQKLLLHGSCIYDPYPQQPQRFSYPFPQMCSFHEPRPGLWQAAGVKLTHERHTPGCTCFQTVVISCYLLY